MRCLGDSDAKLLPSTGASILHTAAAHAQGPCVAATLPCSPGRLLEPSPKAHLADAALRVVAAHVPQHLAVRLCLLQPRLHVAIKLQ